MQIEGIWYPDDVGDRWQHALMHVKSAEWAIVHCPQRRTAVQAGGNVGLWPRRMAQSFEYVVTFEPDQESRECLRKNVPSNVSVMAEALGSDHGLCGMLHRSLGSHNVIDGDSVPLATLDGLNLSEVDLIQLDVEGYEMKALLGAEATVDRCQPLVQVELREKLLEKYGTNGAVIRQWFTAHGYRQVSAQQGSDFVFAPRRLAV